MNNAFTVDVEDYFQVEALSSSIRVTEWDSYDCRVEKNTNLILKMLSDVNKKGTFFVLGWIAQKFPDLIRDIANEGHEIASHGMSHQLIYNQSIDVFRKETIDSKSLLEDIVQKPVEGYRAATYSITKRSLWALDILVEAGFKYDSSIFPMKHDNYGIADINAVPHLLTTPNGHQLVEFPISTLKNKLLTIPIAGGGYFRLFPYFFSRWGLSQINKQQRPFVFYIHPWEVDPEQPVVPNIGWFSKFRHYNNLHKCEARLSRLTKDFELTTMKSVLVELGLLE
jgi:polysaccharide deacetylase family protein (PEP-CTERM system associated)